MGLAGNPRARAGPEPARPGPRGRGPPHRHADPDRRKARRGRLPVDAGHRRLRPAGTRRVQASHREDRGLDLLRRQEHLRLGAVLGVASRSAASPTRCGATRTSCARTTRSPCSSTRSTTGATGSSSTPTPSAACPTARSPTRARPTSTGTPSGTCKTGDFDGGWTIEMAIPFKSLRYQPGRDQTWGINLRRVVRWKNEWSYLTQMPRALTDVPRHPEGVVGGTLVGLQVPSGSRNIEIKPYALAGVATDNTVTPPVSQRRQPARRRRREVRHHPEPDGRPHREHRLRAGRGRRAAGEPHALQPVLSREARLLPRGRRHLRVRRARQRRPRAPAAATRPISSSAGASVSMAGARSRSASAAA